VTDCSVNQLTLLAGPNRPQATLYSHAGISKPRDATSRKLTNRSKRVHVTSTSHALVGAHVAFRTHSIFPFRSAIHACIFSSLFFRAEAIGGRLGLPRRRFPTFFPDAIAPASISTAFADAFAFSFLFFPRKNSKTEEKRHSYCAFNSTCNTSLGESNAARSAA
jgi:hypothetical protein